MNHDALNAAVYRLDRLVYEGGGVGLPPSADQSPQANAIRDVYGWCERILGMGRSAQAGGTPNVVGGVTSHEIIRDLIERDVETWPYRTELLKMVSAGQLLAGVVGSWP
ncbi:MAG: hypothetical protein ACREBY_10300 [Polaromonas sp.]